MEDNNILNNKFVLNNLVTIEMSQRSNIVSQNIPETVSGQPLLAPTPFQTQFGASGYGSQAMLNYQSYQSVPVNIYFEIIYLYSLNDI